MVCIYGGDDDASGSDADLHVECEDERDEEAEEKAEGEGEGEEDIWSDNLASGNRFFGRRHKAPPLNPWARWDQLCDAARDYFSRYSISSSPCLFVSLFPCLPDMFFVFSISFSHDLVTYTADSRINGFREIRIFPFE